MTLAEMWAEFEAEQNPALCQKEAFFAGLTAAFRALDMLADQVRDAETFGLAVNDVIDKLHPQIAAVYPQLAWTRGADPSIKK